MLGLAPCFNTFGYISPISRRLFSLCAAKHSTYLNLFFTHKRGHLCRKEDMLFIQNNKLRQRNIKKLKELNSYHHQKYTQQLTFQVTKCIVGLILSILFKCHSLCLALHSMLQHQQIGSSAHLEPSSQFYSSVPDTFPWSVHSHYGISDMHPYSFLKLGQYLEKK